MLDAKWWMLNGMDAKWHGCLGIIVVRQLNMTKFTIFKN